MADQDYTMDLLPPGLVEDVMAKYTYGLGGCMQYPPIECSQARFPLSPMTDSGPYYSPLPWYGSQEEEAGDLSTLPCYEAVEDNDWSYEPFSWFDLAKRDCVPLVCNDFQQQAGEQCGTDPFNLMIDPMLTAFATNYDGAPHKEPTDTNVNEWKRRDSGYESGTVTSPELSSVGEPDKTEGPDYCKTQLAQYVPPGYLHRLRLSRAPKLSITKRPVLAGDIPPGLVSRFKLSRHEPAINASAHKPRTTPKSRTIPQRPRKPFTKTPKPKPTSQTINEEPKPERALDKLHRSTRSQAVAHEQAARHAWLLSCCERLKSPSTVTKIASEILPPPLTLTRDARDILIDCCVEFITMLSSEANDTMEREAKKTIAAEHIASALRELGFPEYVEEVLLVAGEQKEEFKKREKRSRKVEESGLTQEELAEAQAALFRQAGEKYREGAGE